MKGTQEFLNENQKKKMQKKYSKNDPRLGIGKKYPWYFSKLHLKEFRTSSENYSQTMKTKNEMKRNEKRFRTNLFREKRNQKARSKKEKKKFVLIIFQNVKLN